MQKQVVVVIGVGGTGEVMARRQGTGPQSSFITGTDLLVDGGVVAALRSGRLTHRAGLRAA